MNNNAKESDTLNLKQLNDQELLTQTQLLVQKERHLLTQILHHLKEVDRRKLFSDLGYQSLFEYTVKELKFSEGQAGRRIQAMRLIKELPEIENKIESGVLSLTNISQAQAYFREVKKSEFNKNKSSTSDLNINKTSRNEPNKMLCNLDKLKLLESLENKSTREGQKIVLQMLPEISIPKEKERILSESHTEIRFVMNQELKNRLSELRSLLGAKGATMKMAELISYMAQTNIEIIKIKKFGKKRVQNEQAQIKVEKIKELQSHLEEEKNQPLFEFQNKASKKESDLPCGAINNTKNINNNLQIKRKLPYSKQAKAKIQQNEIAPELQCNMNFTAKNNSSFKNIYEDGLSKKPIAPEFICNKRSKTIKNHLASDEIPKHRFSELASKPNTTENTINRSTVKSTSSRYISQLLKYQIWQRDQGKCQKCSSQSFLNIDHIKPIAIGGESKLENLRLLCFNCNARQAVKVFGLKRMESFL
ncbi:MAG: HNH endonuclease [Bdellovibrionaceae bacterium]|nr:HNH endonuclease [Pseudobdellovibrionaceae bacterium]